MTSGQDLFLFGALPYVALFVFIVVTIERYRDAPFSYSSLSSQFLENKQHFYALVPFHYGLLGVLLAHFLGLFIPRQVLLWNSVPLRLYVMEVTGLILGIMALIGLIGTVSRRLTSPRLRPTTLPTDWLVSGLLFVQIASGIAVAVFHPWGSSWYASTAVPYLWSLAFFQPDLGLVAGMPWLVKLHIVNAFLIVLVFPFTRLVHVLVMPNHYLWRKPQVVRWYWNRRSIRNVA
ncbi:MAG: Respiratory nitrate reductase 1 gamma chain [bacterium]|nr:Respiratory nitrate reductase 1 gamma chain [bacterium]